MVRQIMPRHRSRSNRERIHPQILGTEISLTRSCISAKMNEWSQPESRSSSISPKASRGEQAEFEAQSRAFEQGKAIPFYFRQFLRKYFSRHREGKVRR